MDKIYTGGRMTGKTVAARMAAEAAALGTEYMEKKARKRTGIPNRSSEAKKREFISQAFEDCPRLMGTHRKEALELPVDTVLSRVIHAIDFSPSSLLILADQATLIKRGYLTDEDRVRLTVRELTSHCTKPMLDELAVKMVEHEFKLDQAARGADPSTDPDIGSLEELLAPLPETEIIMDPVLGRCEVDCATGDIVRIIPDIEPSGDVLVDSEDQVEVTMDTETAKQSKDWGSW